MMMIPNNEFEFEKWIGNKKKTKTKTEMKFKYFIAQKNANNKL